MTNEELAALKEEYRLLMKKLNQLSKEEFELVVENIEEDKELPAHRILYTK